MVTSGQLHEEQECIKIFCLCKAENTQNSRGVVPCPRFLGILMPIGVVTSATAWLDASVLFFTSGSAMQYVYSSSKASQRQTNCCCMVKGTCDCGWCVSCLPVPPSAQELCVHSTRVRAVS